jgi:hypothetical protein
MLERVFSLLEDRGEVGGIFVGGEFFPLWYAEKLVVAQTDQPHPAEFPETV